MLKYKISNKTRFNVRMVVVMLVVMVVFTWQPNQMQILTLVVFKCQYADRRQNQSVDMKEKRGRVMEERRMKRRIIF